MACKGAIHKGYFTLPELSAFSGLGIRFLRDTLKHPGHPLPHFRLSNKTIIVSRLEFAEWLESFRVATGVGLEEIVSQVMTKLSK
jgi:hypothetical protein